MSDDAVYCFGEFVLDTVDRQLRHAGRPVRLNARYFDALVLLVREQGRLVDKEQFFKEVWKGISVGDEALTQCMRTLRRCLGDDASNPRFIETVPKHGYRFVAPVDHREAIGAPPEPTSTKATPAERTRGRNKVLAITSAGTLGGAVAGVLGGLIYGIAIAFGSTAPDVGAVSILVLLMVLTVMVGAMGAFGVSLGWAGTDTLAPQGRLWRIAGAALGGALVGGLTSTLGLDVFNLLLGQAPQRMTGAVEGAVLGAAIGLGLLLNAGARRHASRILVAGLVCAIAGAGIVLLGGTLMAGSLDSLATSVVSTDLPLDRIDPFLAGVGFDGGLEVLLAALEGLLFGTGVVGAIDMVRRRERG